MVPHPAVGIDATQAGTRVLTLSTDAGLVRGTVGVYDTLRPAVGRGADHFRQAGALASFPNSSGRVGVGSTRIRITGINILHRFDGCMIKEKNKLKP